MTAIAVSVRDARGAPADRLWIQSVYRDYLDDRRFPPAETSGVLVVNAPDERQLTALIDRVNRTFFQTDGDEAPALPLAGRKLQIYSDWGRDR